MIVSASYRTDIPAFYSDWFRARLEAGWCLVRNPYGGKDYRVSLDPADVDGFVFWTRNSRPFEAVLEQVAERNISFYVQYTLTGLPRALERSVVQPEKAVEAIHDLAARFGPSAVVWRYDPVLFTSLTPPDWHLETFGRLAEALHGTVDEVVVSCAQIYRKSARNLDAAARRHGFTWRDPEDAEKQNLLSAIAAIARGRGMRPTLCSQPALLASGIDPARCIDAERLQRVSGKPLKTREKGNRPGCLCAESRDIGAYDTCPHGCVYCYAVADEARARSRHAAIDPAAPRLDPGALHENSEMAK